MIFLPQKAAPVKEFDCGFYQNKKILEFYNNLGNKIVRFLSHLSYHLKEVLTTFLWTIIQFSSKIYSKDKVVY